jgi:hypothetical protein
LRKAEENYNWEREGCMMNHHAVLVHGISPCSVKLLENICVSIEQVNFVLVCIIYNSELNIQLNMPHSYFTENPTTEEDDSTVYIKHNFATYMQQFGHHPFSRP